VTGPAGNQDEDEMREAIRRREARRDAWQHDGERSVWRNLSMIGALGWLIIVPTLLGILLGRWLDKLFSTGIFFTGALIVLGVSFGSYLAWIRMNRE
jgi:ATP synthase protein I